MRTRSWGVAASVAAVMGSLVVAIAPTATAEAGVTCTPTARLFTVQADGDLWLYEHGAPATGEFAWAGARQIGWGWGGKTLAGPDGVVYNITDTGQFRRFRWNGSTWDNFGNSAYQVMMSESWVPAAADRNLITVDARGDFFKIQDGALWQGDVRGELIKWKQVAGNFGGYDFLAASGEGVLYARTTGGDLHRFRYHEDSDRFYEADRPIGRDWRDVWKIVGAGGGVLYATQSDGDLYWNHDTADDDLDVSWANPTGRVVGYDWANDRDTVAAPDACARSPKFGPERPAVSDVAESATTVVEITHGLRTFHVADRAVVTSTEQGDGSFAFRSFNLGAPTAASPVAAIPGNSGNSMVLGQGTDADLTEVTVGLSGPVFVWGRRRALSPTAPVLTRRANGVPTAYFVDTAGALWSRSGGANLDSLDDRAWRRVQHNAQFATRPAALPQADGTVVLAAPTTQGGTLRMIWERDGKPVKQWDVPGAYLAGTPALVQENATTFRVVGRGPHGSIHTLTFSANAPSQWTTLVDWTANDGTAGTVTAAVDQYGRISVAYRAWRDNNVYVLAQTQPGGDFGTPTRVGDVTAGSDPTLFTRASSGLPVLVFRDTSGATYLYNSGQSGYSGGRIS